MHDRRSFTSSPRKKKNKYALANESLIQTVTNKAQAICHNECKNLSVEERNLWNLILAANARAQDIHSCDLPSDDPNDATLVKMVQDDAEKILNDHENKSWLQKILDVAILSKNIGAGNCQEKAFFGFAFMLHNMIKKKINFASLSLAYFKNHFVVLINEKFLFDPWLNLQFPLPENKSKTIESVFSKFGDLKYYYSISSSGKECYTHEVIENAGTCRDNCSEEMMKNCLQLLESKQYFAFAEARTEHQEIFLENNKSKRMTQTHANLFGSESKKFKLEEVTNRHSNLDEFVNTI